MKRTSETKNLVVLLFCVAVLVAVHGSPPAGLSPAGYKMLGISFIAAILWSTEAVALPVTALIIIFLKTVFSISPIDGALRYLAHPVNALIFVGFCLAAGLKKYNLDREISLRIIEFAGTNVKKLLFCVMCAVAFLSMWMSNTATAAVMIPIVAGILKMSRGNYRNLGKIFMIGIAYAGTIGGMATPVGTTPNPIAIAFLDELAGIQITFLGWVAIGLPFVIVLLPIAWLILLRLFPPETPRIIISENILKEDRTPGEEEKTGRKKFAGYFSLLILLWFAGSFFPVPSGWLYIVSLGGSVAMFLPSVGVLSWKDTKESVNWGVMILIGGGLAMGGGLVSTGAIDWLVGLFASHAGEMPLFLVVLTVASITSLGTLLFCSITATSTAFVPIAIALAIQTGASPVIFAATAGIASSFAYLLPANTPPNAIAYGSGYFDTPDMIKAGSILLVSSLLIFGLISAFIWPFFF